jgi:iron complex transport system ATP-binding protein
MLEVFVNNVAVKAEDLVVNYRSLVALDNSTFEIPEGLITAIIGPNGSGKSTMLSTIAGLVEPASGSLELFPGQDRVPTISFVLQTTKVNDALPISVQEVVAMGRYANKGIFERLTEEDSEAISAAMERTGVSDLARRHLSGLSGGQRQRAFVAQGLAQDHDLLLLDEPLTGIDIAAAQAIDRVIHNEIAEGCSVIMTTHDLTEARIADHVLLLSGRVVATGSPDEVLTTENLMAAYGPSLLHVEDGRVFLDDAAHRPTASRHLHRERTIHTESSPGDLHSDD